MSTFTIHTKHYHTQYKHFYNPFEHFHNPFSEYGAMDAGVFEESEP